MTGRRGGRPAGRDFKDSVRRALTGVLAALSSAVLATPVAAAASPAPLSRPADSAAVASVAVAACERGRAEGVESMVAVPWHHRWFDLERAWSLAGVRSDDPDANPPTITVAVVDTGVDIRQPQLAPVVLPGIDLVDGGDGRVDCTGHGTGIASLIAAARDTAVGFAGVAPNARILPVRVTERIDDISPDVAAVGVDWAVDQGARIVVLAFDVLTDSPALQAAVARAVEHDVLVVASGGVWPGDEVELQPYPATYPGVLGVNAVNAYGLVDSRAWPGFHVDLAAPGIEVTAAAPARGHTVYSGPDMAAATVAGVAALVWTRFPDASAENVAARLIATADPSPGGHGGPSYGSGIVSPVRALSEPFTAAAGPPEPTTLPPLTRPAAPPPGPGLSVAVAFGVASLSLVGFVLARRTLRSARENSQSQNGEQVQATAHTQANA